MGIGSKRTLRSPRPLKPRHPDQVRADLALADLRGFATAHGADWSRVEGEVDQRRRTSGLALHLAAMSVLLDWRAGVWSP